MNGLTLEERYFQRMASSLGDKARILPWIRPEHVVDAGAGGGELSMMMRDVGLRVTALDADDESVRRLRAISGIDVRQVVLGLSSSAWDVPPADTVVFCSILHEVYSYAPLDHRQTAWLTALRSASETLSVGGRLIVRDGVMPDSPNERASFSCPDDELVREYLSLSIGGFDSLRLERDGRWHGTRAAVAEALFSLVWGRNTLRREAQERYGVATLAGVTSTVSAMGLQPLHCESYIQPGYRQHLGGYDIRPRGARWFPDTNALWVFQKRRAHLGV